MLNRKPMTHRRRFLLVIKIMLVLILGHVIIRTTVMPQRVGETFAPNSAGGGENAAAVETAVAPDNPAPDYSEIFERDLFGSRVSALHPGQSVPADDGASSVLPSEDELEIALLGTVAGSPAISRAIIKDLETNVLGQYKTGETVLTASIESIEKDRIVLLHRGRRKVLYLRTPESGRGESDSAQATLQANAPQPVGASPPPRPVATFADKLRHTATLLPKATVEPYSVAGEVEGLRVTDLENIGGAQDLGLRDGDVIRAINGHQLNSKQKAFQIAMKARSQSTLSVELMRDNRIRTFSLPLR